MPTFRSEISITSVRRIGLGSESRISLPGFISSAITSCSVGKPTPISAAAFSRPYVHFFRKIGKLPGANIFRAVSGYLQELFGRCIGLRVDSRVVQHVFTFGNTQEACRLLIGLRTELGHLLQLAARAKCAVFLPIGNNFFAVAAVSPEMRRSSEGDAVLTSTPTAFTQSSTTPSRAASNCFSGISC